MVKPISSSRRSIVAGQQGDAGRKRSQKTVAPTPLQLPATPEVLGALATLGRLRSRPGGSAFTAPAQRKRAETTSAPQAPVATASVRTAKRPAPGVDADAQAPTRKRLKADRSAVVATADVGVQTVINDIHNHSVGPGYAPHQVYDARLTLAQNLERQIGFFDAAGVERFVWAPIPTVINQTEAVTGCCGSHGHDDAAHDAPGIAGKTRTYYMPDEYRFGRPVSHRAYRKIMRQPQSYNTAVDYQVAKAYDELPPALQRRVLLSITGVNLGDANAVAHILRLKKEHPGRFFFMGEITKVKEFVAGQNRNFKPDFSPQAPVNDLFRAAGRMGMPTILHCDASDAGKCIRDGKPGAGEYFGDLDRMFARHPDTTFVWAHTGLGKFTPPGADHVAQLRKILANNPNVMIDMSWDAVARHYSPHPERTPNMRPDAPFDVEADRQARRRRILDMAALIRDYPDRFVMGSDSLVACGPDSLTGAYAHYANFGAGKGRAMAHGLFDYLPPAVLQKVLHGNFDALAERAVRDGLRYEAEQLDADLGALQRATNQAGRVPNAWPD